MKFSEIRQGQWKDLQPYLDTCLLPLTGLTGEEEPWKAAESLGRLGDLMLLLEEPYKGRIVTYPALHYMTPPGAFAEAVNHTCRMLKSCGFKHVILVSADPAVSVMRFEEADLFVTSEYLDGARYNIDHAIGSLWQTDAGKDVTN